MKENVSRCFLTQCSVTETTAQLVNTGTCLSPDN